MNAEDIKAIENWTYNLAMALKEKGHEIVIFAAKKSDHQFKLIPPDRIISAEKAMSSPEQYNEYLQNYFKKCLQWSKDNNVDIVHDQTTAAKVLELANSSETPVVSTFHVIRNNPNDKGLYYKLNNLQNISPSKYLAEASTPLVFMEIIPHGINNDFFKFNQRPRNGFIFVGKIIESKGPLNAVKAAIAAKQKLIICGGPMFGKNNESYYKNFLEIVRKNKNIVYLGKVSKKKVSELMANSRALLMPYVEPEAFGLVKIESLACGTPVIVFDLGTAREIISDGITGFVVPKNDINGLSDAMIKITQIKREKCREIAIKYFSHIRMVNEYIKIYKKIIGENNESRN